MVLLRIMTWLDGMDLIRVVSPDFFGVDQKAETVETQKTTAVEIPSYMFARDLRKCMDSLMSNSPSYLPRKHLLGNQRQWMTMVFQKLYL